MHLFILRKPRGQEAKHTKIYEMPSENQPLLVADGDEDAAPNYPRASRRRIIRDCLVFITLIVLSGVLIVL